MKLVIQIPCFNEEETLSETLAQLPKQVEGFDKVELLVIDDGSTDGTAAVAKGHGVDHLVRFATNRGLARAFCAGIDAALSSGADVIVNTDGDNQYDGSCISTLVRPILDGCADMVIGDRGVNGVPDFSKTKRTLQTLGSWVVRRAAHVQVADVTSGFRAFSRDAALRLVVTDNFTYTLETIIQAGAARMAVVGVPIRTNPKTRESRLHDGTWDYVGRSAVTIVRACTMYHPLRAFLSLASLFAFGGAVASSRFLYYFLTASNPTGHAHSLILATLLILAAFESALFGLWADRVVVNRKRLKGTLRQTGGIEVECRTS